MIPSLNSHLKYIGLLSQRFDLVNHVLPSLRLIPIWSLVRHAQLLTFGISFGSIISQKHIPQYSNTNGIIQFDPTSFNFTLCDPYCLSYMSHIQEFRLLIIKNFLLTKGRFTPWTMKSDHGRWPFPMVRCDASTSMVRFLKNSIYKVFGPFTRCKSNVEQEEWPCTNKVDELI